MHGFPTLFNAVGRLHRPAAHGELYLVLRAVSYSQGLVHLLARPGGQPCGRRGTGSAVPQDMQTAAPVLWHAHTCRNFTPPGCHLPKLTPNRPHRCPNCRSPAACAPVAPLPTATPLRAATAPPPAPTLARVSGHGCGCGWAWDDGGHQQLCLRQQLSIMSGPSHPTIPS